jgi:hypothetical protein
MPEEVREDSPGRKDNRRKPSKTTRSLVFTQGKGRSFYADLFHQVLLLKIPVERFFYMEFILSIWF